tara:strand:- start:3035 stop:3670 length:636 start_codon:yes stop_codon:yes gene_type:complete
MRSVTLLFLWFFSSLALGGQYHVCVGTDGKKSFQDKPCDDAERSEVREYRSSDKRVASDGWSFYEKDDAITGEAICLIRSGKSIKGLPHKSFAGVQLTVIMINGSPVVGLYSSPTFSEVPKSFMYDYYPLLKVGGLSAVRAIDMQTNVAMFSANDSQRIVREMLSKGSPEIMYRAKFFPYENQYDFNVSYSGFESAYSKLMACEGVVSAGY